MSIDGIGGPPRGSGPIGSGLAPAAAGGAEVFRAPGGAEVPAASGSELLGRLERGEISVDAYLDGQVDAAVGPFVSKLDPETLGFLRASLREQLSTDPVLVELVRRSTEGVPVR